MRSERATGPGRGVFRAVRSGWSWRPARPVSGSPAEPQGGSAQEREPAGPGSVPTETATGTEGCAGTDARTDDSGTGGDSGTTDDSGTTGDSGTGSGGDSGTGSGGGSGGARPAQRSLWKELPILVGMALILALGIKTFFVQAFSIPSASMENTLQEGDRVLVDKFTPWFGAEPQRGEVVVFRDPGGWLPDEPAPGGNAAIRGVHKAFGFIGLMPSADEKDLIKRVIAVGGDTVDCNSAGPVKVNGVPLDEPYIFPGATPCGDLTSGTVKVPKGHLWVMGDHRNDSWDSRAHVDEPGGGFVPVKNVIGRAFTVAWPVPRWAMLPVPGTFHQRGIEARGGQQRTVSGGVSPAALGLAGAVPLALWRRRAGLRPERAAAGRAGGRDGS